MKRHPSSVPHFLRVAQALALVSGVGVPAAGLLVSACGSSSGSGIPGVADSGSTRDAHGTVDSGIIADTSPELDSSMPDVQPQGVQDSGSDVLGNLDSGSDVLGVADSGEVADAPDEVLGILVMPEGGDAESGGGPGFFPDLPV